MRYKNAFSLGVVLCLGFLASDPLLAETWTDSSGQFRVEADFERIEKGLVYLKKSDGQVVAVPVQRLSPESIAQAKRLHAASAPDGQPLDPEGALLDSSASKLSENPTARETAEVMSQALAHFHLPTLWDGLTPRYQSDVQQSIRMQAGAIETATWNSISALIKKASELAQTKRDMFLNNPTLGAVLNDDQPTRDAWDAAADVLAAIANSQLTDHEAMKQFDMQKFIASDAPAIRNAFVAFTEKVNTTGESPFGKLAETPKIETLSESETEAVFRITMGEEVTDQKFVKVENRWLPAEMVEGWDQAMAEQQAAIAKMKSPEGRQQMMQMQMGVMMVGAPMNALLDAKTQAEFDQVIESLAQTFGGTLGAVQVEEFDPDTDEAFQLDAAPQ